MMNFQRVNKLTVSKDVAEAVKEIMKFFDNEAFDGWNCRDIVTALDGIAKQKYKIEVFAGENHLTEVEIEIKDK